MKMSLVKQETSATLSHVGKRPSSPTYLFPYKRKSTQPLGIQEKLGFQRVIFKSDLESQLNFSFY